MAINKKKIHTLEHIANASFDNDNQVAVVHPLGYDGVNLTRKQSEDLQIKIVKSGDYTYICFSAPGVSEGTAKWKVFRIDSSGNKLYADANAEYDNLATDPTALTYSYS